MIKNNATRFLAYGQYDIVRKYAFKGVRMIFKELDWLALKCGKLTNRFF